MRKEPVKFSRFLEAAGGYNAARKAGYRFYNMAS